MHGRLFAFARFDCAAHEGLNRFPILTRKMHIILGALQKLRADGFEDEREFHLHRRHQVEADQPAGDVRADTERAEVHRLEVILCPPVQRDSHLAAALVHFEHRRLREVEEEDVAERPETHADSCLVHRRVFSMSILRRAYGAVARSQIAFGMSRPKRISSDIGRGNSTTRLPPSKPSAITRAASSTFIRNGILNRFLSVIAVMTNPGLTVVTPTPYCRSSTRLASRKACMAAFVAE